ncbi:hypothetical protein [Streptomyces sp. FXY-T5]|uniref:hypothetical protein n=1 Tax=Streptomyces sp. FXY-T5 TaxID=3064901 RepID=UPI0027D27EA3|nr:hypothetical protein [Streptomyces sp. FXY-T5]WMD06386.1 hypothetical protein Q7C01_19210 [Streptomyces sp. FXY-T5]
MSICTSSPGRSATVGVMWRVLLGVAGSVPVPLAGQDFAELKTVADAPAALLHRRPALPRSARLRLLLPARAKAAPAWGLFPFPIQPGPLPDPVPVGAPEQLGLAEEVRPLAAQRRPIVPPTPHPSGARPPKLTAGHDGEFHRGPPAVKTARWSCAQVA